MRYEAKYFSKCSSETNEIVADTDLSDKIVLHLWEKAIIKSFVSRLMLY